MKKTKIMALVLCTGLLLTGCGKIPTLANGEQVVAKIEGKDFTAEELYQELKGQGGNTVLTNMIDEFIAKKEITDTKDAEEYAKGQLEYIKSQYAASGMDFTTDLHNAGYKEEKDFIDVLMKDYIKQQAAEKYVKDHLTDSEINDYYKREIYGELTVRHILVTPKVTSDMTDDEKSAAETEALNKAKNLIKEIQGGAKFEDVAKKNSDDEGSAAEGGLVSNFSKDSVVEAFWNASLALKDGEMTKEPVKSTYGYHIILRVKQNEKPSKEDAMDTIKDGLYSEKSAADATLLSKAWVSLRKAYKLDIIDSEIKEAYKTANKDFE